MSQSYGDLWNAVNDRHKELTKEGVDNIDDQLKKEFNLSISEVWEITGISELLLALDMGYEIDEISKKGSD